MLKILLSASFSVISAGSALAVGLHFLTFVEIWKPLSVDRVNYVHQRVIVAGALIDLCAGHHPRDIGFVRTEDLAGVDDGVVRVVRVDHVVVQTEAGTT